LVGVGVGRGVRVGTGVSVAVGVEVAVEVGVLVAVGVEVGVAVSGPPGPTTDSTAVAFFPLLLPKALTRYCPGWTFEGTGRPPVVKPPLPSVTAVTVSALVLPLARVAVYEMVTISLNPKFEPVTVMYVVMPAGTLLGIRVIAAAG
jgi:hypothetical protein